MSPRPLAPRSRSVAISGTILALAGAIVALGTLATEAQQPPSGEHGAHHRLEAMQVGNPTIGQRLFKTKRCITCHAVKGEGGDVGPDLGRIQHTHNVYQMAAVMWNHSTQMRQAMEAKGIERPTFKSDEMAHLLAYLHSLQVVGDPERGRAVFERKGCAKCHAINGVGGKIGPELARTHHPHPPIELAGMMWNHSPTMTAMMGALGIPRPVFDGNEMADLLAYLDAVQREAARESGRGGHRDAPHRH